jgi:hypothetical protein
MSAHSTIPATAGIGLRAAHHRAVSEELPPITWVEVHAENYFSDGGGAHYWLEKIRCEYALSLHGVGLSIGSADPIDRRHLLRLKHLINRYQPALVSEHLSWSSIDGRFHNDLLPLPFTRESLDHVCRRIDQIQNALHRSILIENISSYLILGQPEFGEAEFLTAVARRSGCRILLDVNNVFVSACNHGFDALSYIRSVPPDLVSELHLAGHALRRLGPHELRIDTHDRPVCDEVWQLYADTLKHMSCKPTLIEWDNRLPSLDTLLSQAHCAEAILKEQARNVA